jgi:hypothetical protein
MKKSTLKVKVVRTDDGRQLCPSLTVTLMVYQLLHLGHLTLHPPHPHPHLRLPAESVPPSCFIEEKIRKT